MLFPYTYVPHPMEKMQEFIDFIFYAVWCQAPAKGPYRLELFALNPELYEVMTAFHHDDSEAAYFFSSHVERIYGLFARLNACQVEQLRLWYRGNNDVEHLCANDPTIPMKRYVDFPAEFAGLSDQLASFFKKLYSRVDVAALKKWIGDIGGHYRAFVAVNKSGKCPFCGINDLLGEYHTKREAYDHYLPKALYPFNSINFRNLAPACHHCNSSYKTSKDTAYTPKDPAGVAVRRKAFYPFSKAHPTIDCKVTLPHVNIKIMAASEVALSFGPTDFSEQIETWKDVYGIEERYRAKLLGGDGMAWLVEVLDELRWNEESAGSQGRPPDKYLQDLGMHTQRSPYANANFLKNSFLQACKAVGLFDPIMKATAVVAT
jgi:hypothetical protein